MHDPDRYRDKAEIERWKERDPITLLVTRMRAENGLKDADLDVLEQEVDEELDRALEGAREGGAEPVEDLLRFVHSPTEAAS
ncbi:hypothetical protein [Kitasatospora herbaricolor]|uniref:Uncharacterized protein n=1 Tax=Kitasatospora herbaricolor TaxID=68217 RepID=A0ABZ1W2G9_9ACTN|nr:hypothetical protein [Kitasatospora herbaricolor]